MHSYNIVNTLSIERLQKNEEPVFIYVHTVEYAEDNNPAEI